MLCGDLRTFLLFNPNILLLKMYSRKIYAKEGSCHTAFSISTLGIKALMVLGGGGACL